MSLGGSRRISCCWTSSRYACSRALCNLVFCWNIRGGCSGYRGSHFKFVIMDFGFRLKRGQIEPGLEVIRLDIGKVAHVSRSESNLIVDSDCQLTVPEFEFKVKESVRSRPEIVPGVALASHTKVFSQVGPEMILLAVARPHPTDHEKRAAFVVQKVLDVALKDSKVTIRRGHLGRIREFNSSPHTNVVSHVEVVVISKFVPLTTVLKYVHFVVYQLKLFSGVSLKLTLGHNGGSIRFLQTAL